MADDGRERGLTEAVELELGIHSADLCDILKLHDVGHAAAQERGRVAVGATATGRHAFNET